MNEFIGFLGWVTTVSFGFAILNYLLKFINKKYISKFGKGRENIVIYYKKIMRLVIRYHKLAGITAMISVILHFIAALIYNKILIAGIVSAILMLILFLLGVYGACINKNLRGGWVKIHRAAAFILLITVLIHIILKR